MEGTNQRNLPFRSKPLMVIFHLEDCPHSKGEFPPPPPQTPPKPWTIFFIPFFSSLTALKKAFIDNTEIQRLLDEDFVVLNLMVSQKSAEAWN